MSSPRMLWQCCTGFARYIWYQICDRGYQWYQICDLWGGWRGAGRCHNHWGRGWWAIPDTRYQIQEGRYQIPLAGRYQRLICSQIPTTLLQTPYYTRSYLTWHHIKPHQFIPPHTGAYHTRQPTILLSFFFTSHKHILIELRRQQGTKAAFILYH